MTRSLEGRKRDVPGVLLFPSVISNENKRVLDTQVEQKFPFSRRLRWRSWSSRQEFVCQIISLSHSRSISHYELHSGFLSHLEKVRPIQVPDDNITFSLVFFSLSLRFFSCHGSPLVLIKWHPRIPHRSMISK